MFESVSSIGNVYFYIPNELKKNNVYIILANNLSNYNIEEYYVKKFGYYCVIDTIIYE